MARQKQQLRPTKKHLARAERERILRNRILAGTLITVVLVFGLIGFGLFQELVVVPGEPVAFVGDEEISTRDFQARLIYEMQYGEIQFAAMQYEITVDQAAPIVLDTMINDVIIRQVAENMGIEISEAELDQRIEELFGYYRSGTPTRPPSSTPDPTRNALSTLTAAAAIESTEADVTPTIVNTATPRPTPTEYTHEGFEQIYSDTLATIGDQSGLSEAQFRRIILANLLTQEIKEVLEEDVPQEGEKTQLRHIQTNLEETAQEVRAKLDEGELWEDLVTEYSEDTTTKDVGGNLGWLTNSNIVNGFGISAESLTTETIGTLVGPIQTNQGWHVFEIIDREVQPLTDFEYQQAVDLAYDDWLLELRSETDIRISEDWQERIPDVEISPSGVY